MSVPLEANPLSVAPPTPLLDLPKETLVQRYLELLDQYQRMYRDFCLTSQRMRYLEQTLRFVNQTLVSASVPSEPTVLSGSQFYHN